MKLKDCLEKTHRLPREVKRALIERTQELADKQGIGTIEAAKRVLREARDNAHADAAAVQTALLEAPAPAPEMAAPAPETLPPEVETEAPEIGAPTPEAGTTAAEELDQLFTAEETAPPDQQAVGQAQARAAGQVLDEMSAQMPNGPALSAKTAAEAANELNKSGRTDDARNVKSRLIEAFYDEENDAVVVIPEHVQPRSGESFEDAVRRLVLHEAAGHGGWARLFSGGPLEGRLAGLVEAVMNHLGSVDFGDAWHSAHGYRTLEELAAAYGFDLSTPEGRAETVQEHLARLAEDPNPPRWFDGIVTAITEMLRSIGYNAWTDSDTRVLLAKMRASVGVTEQKAAAARSDAAAHIRFSDNLVEAGSSPEKERKFITSVKEAAGVLPSVKERVQGVYDAISNKETVAAANKWINEHEAGIDGALRELEVVKQGPTAQDYAAGIELIGRLQAAGRYDEAAGLAMNMAAKATSQGQAIQALRLISKLTPAGIALFAGKMINAAVAKDPRLAKYQKQIDDLRAQLRKARQVIVSRAVLEAQRPDRSGSVQERIERQLINNPKSLWGRYKEGAVRELAGKLLGPGKPRGVPSLEAFTSRLVKQLREQIKPGELAGPANRPADESTLIGEAVRNFDKYKEVWAEAQDHVRKLYKDNPAALRALDDYLGQILERPFSEESLVRAAKQVLGDLNANLRDILMSSSADKAQTLTALTREITARSGLTGTDATELAKSIQETFERQMQAERDTLLKSLTKQKVAPEQKSKLERLIDLNNAGALDDNRFFSRLAELYGIPTWSKELSEKVQRLQREAEQAKSPELRLAKHAEMMDAVTDMVPKAILGKVAAYQNLSMLLNPKTSIRNVFGNAVLWVVDLPADALSAWAVDPLVSFARSLSFSKHRTRRSVDILARLQGLMRPVQDFTDGYTQARDAGAEKAASFKEGVRTILTLSRLTSRGKFDLADIQSGSAHAFSSRFMQRLEDGLTLILGVADRAFHQSAFQASLMRQMRVAEADGRTEVGPTPEMLEQAYADAAKAIYQNENFVNKGMNMVRHGLNKATTGSERWGAGSVIIPFVQIPVNIVLRGAAWSPLGFINTFYQGAVAPLIWGEFNQKEFVDSFSRALLGTSGLVATGAWLFYIGVLSGAPDEDDDLEAMRMASGWGKYRINVSGLKRAILSGNWWSPQPVENGDLTVNYDWVQPLAMPIAMGAELMRSHQERERQVRLGLEQQVSGPAYWFGEGMDALRAAANTLEEQPILQGIGRFAARMTGKNEGAITALGETAFDIPTMAVPTFINQVTQLMDNQTRETRAGNVIDKAVANVLSRVPGVEKYLPPKYDVFGEANQRYSYGGNSFFNVMINPSMIRTIKHAPELREMEAIFAATGESAIFPIKARPKVTIAGEKVELTNQQLSEYQRIAGEMTLRAYTTLAANPEFAKAPMGVKAKLVGDAMKEINEATKILVLKGDAELLERLRAQKTAHEMGKAQTMLPAAPTPAGP